MEFIGLLGLVGLVGFFAGRNANDNVDKLKKDVRSAVDKTSDISARVDGNKKNLDGVSGELRRINSALERCAKTDAVEQLSQRLNGLQRTVDNLSPDSAAIRDVVDKISELQQQMTELQIQMNSDAAKFQDALKNLRSELGKQRDDFDERIKALENSAPTIDDSALKNLTARVNTLDSRFPELGKQRDDFDKRIKALENSAPTIDDSALKNLTTRVDMLDSRFDDAMRNLTTRFNALDGKFSEYDKTLKLYQDYFGRIQGAFNFLQTKVLGHHKVLPQHEERIKSLEQKISPPPPDIRDFQIKKSDAPLFGNNPADAQKTLAVIENLSGITAFLESSRSDKKSSFIRQLEIYRKNLGKFSDRIKRGKFDKDNFSEEATDAFFNVLSKYFLAALPVAILRGGKEDPKFYGELLTKINEYLSSCRVYTEFVEPKKLVTTNQLEFMDVVKKDTASSAEDKFIDEVERLPYFVDYLTDDGETERFCSEGKMVVLKFGDKK